MGLSFWTVRSSGVSAGPVTLADGVRVALSPATDAAEQPVLSISPLHLSCGSLELIEMADDNSNDDNTDIDPLELGHTLSFERKLDRISSTTLLHHLSQTVYTRPTADLFVLHHAWRSFLS